MPRKEPTGVLMPRHKKALWATDADGVFDDLQSLFLTIVVATVAYMLIWPYCMAYDCRAGRLEDRDDL